jgi:kynureninase
MDFENTLAFAKQLDLTDPLKNWRNEFIIPEKEGRQLTYFLGNSLGLQPKSAAGAIQRILNDWSSLGVEAFFHAAEPWMNYHNQLVQPLAAIMGALPQEIVVMNQLTVNLHLMLVSFYRPAGKRYKIICEAKAFPSDQYAFETHVRQHGYDPADAIIEVHPRQGEFTLRTADIMQVIEEHADETALVLFGGINYYTGQVFNMEAIARMAQQKGIKVGFDLAHAAGNIGLKLHDWQVDFACWCTYKYLNSGPGAIGGVFIHEKNHSTDIPRLAGWWGYDEANRFKMEKGFVPMPGAEGWQLSTPSLLLYATHKAALDIVQQAGWENIQVKRKKLTAYLWYLLQKMKTEIPAGKIDFITPHQEAAHGSQVSMLMLENGKSIYDELMQQGFMVDWREPDVIRFAPVPLYNTHEEVWRFVDALKKLIK